MIEAPVNQSYRILLAFLGAGAAMLMGVIFFLVAPASRHAGSPFGYFLFAPPLFLGLSFFLIYVTFSPWVRIEPEAGRVSQVWKVFGATLREKQYALSAYDRVSLHRGIRGGYWATLVGSESELGLFFSTDLGAVRRYAESAAVACRLKVVDKL